jgi:hypothetical protein
VFTRARSFEHPPHRRQELLQGDCLEAERRIEVVEPKELLVQPPGVGRRVQLLDRRRRDCLLGKRG